MLHAVCEITFGRFLECGDATPDLNEVWPLEKRRDRTNREQE